MDYNWQQAIRGWVSQRPTLGVTSAVVEQFFERAFESTAYPERSWFGLHSTAASLVMGGLYLAAIQTLGEDRGVWVVTDGSGPALPGVAYRVVKSAKVHRQLHWAYAAQFHALTAIVRSDALWRSIRASFALLADEPVASDRDSVQISRKKVRVSDFFVQGIPEPETDFHQKVIASIRGDAMERRQRLEKASGEALRRVVTTTVFDRNPDVVAEVLTRANGRCELCQNPAPFLRRSDGTPYLEVHHRHRLADGGADVVENSLACCPDCHRKAHLG